MLGYLKTNATESSQRYTQSTQYHGEIFVVFNTEDVMVATKWGQSGLKGEKSGTF